MKKINLVLKSFTSIILFMLGSFLFMFQDVYASSSYNNSFYTNDLPTLAPMLEKVMPAVISINIDGRASLYAHNSHLSPSNSKSFFGENSPFCQDGSPFQGSPLCQGNGNHSSTQERFRALGSGVIIDAVKGYAVTNNHVIENAVKIQVQLNDARHCDAQILVQDSRSDIALIKLNDCNNLTSIKIADSNSVRVGDYAVAIGNPYGLGETVTSGIISALGRSGLNIENYENFIQTDAAINRGNSGGALINLNGELIGINTAILAPDGGNIGIGFAIPGNIVNNLVKQMVSFGKVKRGELGIIGTELNSELAKVMQIDAHRGAFVSQVLPKSEADRSGIKAGDVIVELNRKKIYSFSALRADIGSLPVGTKIELGLLRSNGRIEYINLTLQKSGNVVVKEQIIDKYNSIEGADFIEFRINGKNIVKTIEVKYESKAYRIGLRKDDIILSINKIKISNLKILRNLLHTKPSVLAIHVQRGSNTLYLLLQ
ncbi:Do family serine endopeptidase [Buchnera aphidicola]|uniref:Do family serine endopeptidase n=1 Tax=Buchnera aphidicola TaxID=9 RepID=UPI003D18C664